MKNCVQTLFIFALCAAFSSTIAASAAPIFDSGAVNFTLDFAPGASLGEGSAIAVSTTTTIGQMAVPLYMTNGGNVTFVIWNSTNSALLFSQTVPVAAGGSGLATNYVLSNPFSFTLNAGNTYYFGALGNTNISIGGHHPPVSTTMNGLTSIASGQAYYTLSGSTPVFQGYETDPSSEVTVGLRLYAGSAVPEPTFLFPLGLALAGVLVARRRRLIF